MTARFKRTRASENAATVIARILGGTECLFRQGCPAIANDTLEPGSAA